MRAARPDNKRGQTSAELTGHGNPPTADEAEAQRLLAELAAGDDDPLDEKNKKPKKKAPAN